MRNEHDYAVSVEWTGNRGAGTQSVRGYGRDHVIRAAGGLELLGSADPSFHGDADRWNPEQLLLAALSQCHLMSYLYQAAKHGVVVESYRDDAVGVLRQAGEGGAFASATLRPVVTVSAGDPELARRLHADAAETCFIRASVAFPVGHEPTILLADDPLS
ncbi:OsmC family protein [Homoserinibacter sp. YIM 151385]|uniref:OsmC family protein n=1 Tax=Homoserinibacter sp. YIM 151385 TaxID=2985506 RepID=UPI0022F126BF|nr:OsmC family protein [Homoserinibacter sp. YIM 151385]WBU38321.1 OsmC family protein [Homoserinibacter sp. YIM 151385]